MILRGPWTPDGGTTTTRRWALAHETRARHALRVESAVVTPLRVLIGCRTSGVMRRAFARLGRDAWSRDLLPGRGWQQSAYPGRRARSPRGWLGSAGGLPPSCTPLQQRRAMAVHPAARSHAARHVGRAGRGRRPFRGLLAGAGGSCRHRNPVMHRHARERPLADLPKPQIVQPWWFGNRSGFTCGACQPCRRPIA